MLCLLISTLHFTLNTNAQTISFGASSLVGESVLNPTSLEFGPDNRLYVAQQDGKIWAYTISRDAATSGNGTYTITGTEAITTIQTGIVNHDDSGISNPTQQRLITGIVTAGTPTNPILYVTSSDFLFGGGGAGSDTNLDTNSGILSKLEWNGTSWDKVDLIRGLPRCEENHAINGMDTFERAGNKYLLIVQGGNTNKGAPSNNFAGTPEYFLSASMLIVDLTQLEGMPTYTDPRNNTDYVYDLPTLNDPTRLDIDKTHPDFPYPVGHPLRDATIDVNDPFGGNNSLNQAFPEAGGPIQLFAPGFRNAYDVVVTDNGRIYTSDNGPNSLWGGVPKIYDSATDAFLGDESTVTYDPLNHYIKNEMNESGSSLIGDPLHFVGTINDPNKTYYGGHPIPINAFPSRAEVIAYKKINGSWVATNTNTLQSLLTGTSGYFNTSFSISDFPDDPRFGEYLVDEPVGSTKVNILDVRPSSTNGILEYKATNFSGIMQGNILTASFNGDINRYVLNAAGDTVLEQEIIFSGFGALPLDITAQGDSDIFPGTIWAATYGANNITIFEPSDLDCAQPGEPGYDPLADNDGDGFSNQDEIDNGTNICSQGSKPNDNDGDFISDLNDPDDDNDTILDVNDAFALDANNGLNTNLPVHFAFWNNDPGTGFFGLGFTGLMLDPSGTTDYLTQFDEADLSFGGAAGKATVDYVTIGDATTNNQDNGFQFGVNVDTNSNPFTIQTKVESPYFGINGSQTQPVDFQSCGISFGNGDQDNYLKLVLMNGVSNSDSVNGLQVVLESNGVTTIDNSYDVPNILDAGSVNLYFSIDPSANTAQPFYSIDDGQTLIVLGSPITLPLNFLDATDNKGLAIGIISTARDASSSSNPFTATWDYIEVYENQNGILAATPTPLDFGLTPTTNSLRTKQLNVSNAGGPTDDAITITALNFTGADAAMFTTDITLPLTINAGTNEDIPIHFISNSSVGIKNASLEIVHSGNNSPIPVNLTGEITDSYSPLVRINAGGPLITASDAGPDWEANDTNGTFTGTSYAVSSGSKYAITTLDYTGKDASIPSYIDQTTYETVMNSQRSISETSIPMIFSIPVPNGDYIVNFYVANLYNGTSDPGERIYSVDIENQRFLQNFDSSETYGHRVAGMIQQNVLVLDGILEIEFFRDIENPMVNAIEILALQGSDIIIDPIADITSCASEISDFSAIANGGDPNENFTYAISGQPSGLQIEPTNGLIFGTINPSAITGGLNSDGVHQVTVTVSKTGSTDAIETFIWTVIEDTEVPVITCPANITQAADTGICEATVTIIEATATDDCSAGITYSGVRDDALLLTDPYPVGVTTITWTATDAAGNDSITCDQTITITEDEIPVITCPENITQAADTGICEATVTITEPTATDNCSTGITYSGVRDDALLLTDPYPVGVTTITWTATDASGNDSVTCEQTVTITEDEVPVITCPENITQATDTGICEATVTIIEPTATDNCSAGITYSGVRDDALLLTDPYPVGDTTITWTATDASGNDSVTCEQTVTITDDEVPVIVCPENITQATDTGICEATVTIIEPTATDNCSTGITYSGVRDDALLLTDPYPVGVTTITWTATDASGNDSVTCDQTITITDDEVPVITCPENITQAADTGICEATVTITEPTATDNCSTGITYSGVRDDALLITDPYPIGVTTITWTATDASGNDSVTCEQTVTITEDEVPVITCPENITQTADSGYCDAIITIIEPTATDNCSAGITYFGVRDDALLLTAPYPVGVTTITWTATDASGNDSVTCEQTITVTDDEIPVITCPTDIVEAIPNGTTEASITIIEPTATENCTGIITYTGVRDDALLLTDPYPLGDTIITWTTTDAYGNVSASCDQTITVKSTYSLHLNVSLQGRTDYTGNYTVIIYDENDLVNPAYSLNATANPVGALILGTEILPGNYKVLVKHPMYLQGLLNVSLTGNQTETVNTLLAGDVNNDNTVTFLDYGILASTYGLNSSQTGYDSRADFDNNLTINFLDYAIVAGNYGLSGETQND
ncbi:HYR domain-containing protein [Lacinutrix gracilariae]|uniref:HYR domain-containing protein n=1 Tax=Lacinutrix gracilariae TaxID=1747198 RepID=A0ABW5JZ35_9FLAO